MKLFFEIIFLIVFAFFNFGCQGGSEQKAENLNLSQMETEEKDKSKEAVAKTKKLSLLSAKKSSQTLRKDSKILADFYFQCAKTAFQEGRLRGAFELVNLTLRENENHQLGRELQQKIAQQIEAYGASNPHRQDIYLTFRELVHQEKVRIQQTQLEIKNQVALGQEAMKLKDFDKAVQHFENALQIIRWMPYPVDISDDKRKIGYLMQFSKERKDQEKEKAHF